MDASGTRLLILACSRRKRTGGDPLPALERYDGPAFRLLRRYLRGGAGNHPQAFVLSAEFGLVPGSRQVPDYDRRMTPSRVRELQLSVPGELERAVRTTRSREVFLCMGRLYAQALGDLGALEAGGLRVIPAPGGSGEQLSALHDWLYGASPASPAVGGRAPATQITLKGTPIPIPPGEVLDAARTALAAGVVPEARPRAWHVLVDGRAVAPKWLVSQLTGQPVSAFHSDDARRVLAALGFEVRRGGSSG